MKGWIISASTRYRCPTCKRFFSGPHFCPGKSIPTEDTKFPPIVYYLHYQCSNCGATDNVKFTKGQEAPKDCVYCKNCGCEKMEKVLR